MPPTNQTSLPLGEAARPLQPWSLFTNIPGLPDGVHPTPVRVLESDGSILIIHQMKHSAKVGRGKERLLRQLQRYDTIDSPGDVTIWLLWGGPGVRCRVVELDGDGKQQPEEVLASEEVRQRIATWFQSRRRR